MTDNDRDPLADLNASPLNPLPGVVWLLLLAIIGIEAVVWAGGAGFIGGQQAVGWRVEAIQRFAFSSAIQDFMLQNMRFPTPHILRYVSFSFIHAAPMHALFGAVLVAALGKSVAQSFGPLRFLLLVLLAPVFGAAVFGLFTSANSLGWLFGAMPMAFALVGGFTWLKWREAAGDVVKQRRAFGMIGILLAARLGFGLFAEAGPAWMAEVVSFAFGFAGSALFLGSGSWARLRARLRG